MPGVVEVDPRSRRAVVTGHGHANARILVDLDDGRATTARVDAHGDWTVTLPEIPFGEHRVAAVQRYDGAANGSDGRDLLVGGAPLVETAHVRFDEQQVLVGGVAVQGTTVGLRRGDGTEIVDASGVPIRPAIGGGGRWQVLLPLPVPGERPSRLDIVGSADGSEWVMTRHVVVPVLLTATVASRTARRAVLTGTAEPGSTVALTHQSGAPLTDSDGAAITAVVGRDGWRRTMDIRSLAGARIGLVAQLDGRVVGRSELTLP